jgi:hypothetical protein
MDPPSPDSGGSGFATANESLSSASYVTADESARPWNNVQDVLCIEDLPSTVSLRKKFNAPCACEGRHRPFREFCKLVIAPSVRKDLPGPQLEV